MSTRGPDGHQVAYGVVDAVEMLSSDGLTFFRRMIAGELPATPMAGKLGFRLSEVDFGRAVFHGTPEAGHYNPIGTVHGGYAMVLLDSACGCAVHTTLARGERYTTLDLNANLVRPITAETGEVRCEGEIVHRGRSVATSQARLLDPNSKLLAHATSTCMIFPAKD